MSFAEPDLLQLPARCVYFDGVCNFCNGAVRWLIARDPNARLHFGSLQGETAQRLRSRHPEFPSDLDTMVLCETAEDGERLYLKSEAVLRIAAQLAGPWRRIAWLRCLPRALRDFAYDRFARNRYRMFGRLDACPIPSPDERARFVP